MDEHITQMDRRLTTVEAEVEALRANHQGMPQHYASKEDLLRLESRLMLLLQQCATKQDLAALELKMMTELPEMRLQLAKLELRLLRWLIGTVITISGVVVAVVKLWV